MAIDSKLYRPHSLPRLHPSAYESDALVLWTHTTFNRTELPLTDKFHFTFRELLLHTCVRQSLLCPAYVLMPDHLHLILLGTQSKSDQLNATRFFRTYLARAIKPIRLQPQPHDHVLTREERTRSAFANACNYILQNPLRAKLVGRAEDWPYIGALLPGYPDASPFTSHYWPAFWKIFQKLRDPHCSLHRPIREIQNNP